MVFPQTCGKFNAYALVEFIKPLKILLELFIKMERNRNIKISSAEILT